MASKKIPLIVLVQSFLSEKFDFRYNEVLGRTEFRFKSLEEDVFRKMREYDFNSIHKMLSEEELACSIGTLRRILQSSYVPKYNPFIDYLGNLPKWDGETDFIDLLSATIETTDNEFFQIAFRKWFVALTGSLLKDEVINHTFLIFTGGQGIGKTTWFNNLIPQQLSEYYYTGVINPNNSDSKIQLAENMLINIDELQGLSYKGIEDLKALVTTKEVKVRRPYASIHELLPHRASFSGSSNSADFLNDATGNRRFLCFETSAINNQHNISIDNVFSQAVHLFNNGFRYWFNQEEINMINKNNEQFKTNSLEEDALLAHLTPCAEDDPDACFGSASAITKLLGTLDSKLRIYNATAQRMGRFLTKYGFLKIKRNGVYGYLYKFKKRE